jgi:membrane fusion protein (multidrug efflux system)
MVALLVLIYAAFVGALFKVFRLKPTPFLIAGILLAGVLMIGGVVVAWTLSAPISNKLVTTQYVTQLVPYVKGQVTAVHAQANQPLKKGDLLLEINPAPYQYAVNQLQAALDQAKAAEANAKANLNKAIAADDLAKTKEKIALGTQRSFAGAISTQDVAVAVQSRVEADAAVQQAESSVVQAQSNIPAVQAQLDEALFNLAQCKMTAPSDGYVVNWQVQPGTMLSPVTAAAAGTFIDTSNIFVAAVFPQNYLTNVEPGNDVEIVLDPYPGRIFTAKVDTVMPASGGGQFSVSGSIPNAANIGSNGLYAVKILFDDETVARHLSLGSGGSAAIYTKRGKPVHIITKVAMRMKKWLAYVVPSVQNP